eukprot:1158716-Pelagomonas_calceolata.AAC.5
MAELSPHVHVCLCETQACHPPPLTSQARPPCTSLDKVQQASQCAGDSAHGKGEEHEFFEHEQPSAQASREEQGQQGQQQQQGVYQQQRQQQAEQGLQQENECLQQTEQQGLPEEQQQPSSGHARAEAMHHVGQLLEQLVSAVRLRL